MLKFEDANDLLVKAFPEMAEIYEREHNYYNGLEYCFYESEFEPFIVEQLKNNNELQIRRICSFVEDMLANGDDELINLLGVAVIESLYFDSCAENQWHILDTIFSHCGEKTRQSFNDTINWHKQQGKQRKIV